MIIDPENYERIVFFTGAGMSAESGVPTYRGSGGVWHAYNWEEYACQRAFDRNPDKVLEFHEMRRQAVKKCRPHQGHDILAVVESSHPAVTIVTQNIDGMHQRAGSRNVVELHGSLWRVRCERHGSFEEPGESYSSTSCKVCGARLRPDITWFEDMLDGSVMTRAMQTIAKSRLFVSIGTSAVVQPAAGFPLIAKENGAFMIEINPEPSGLSHIYDEIIRLSASEALKACFDVGSSD